MGDQRPRRRVCGLCRRARPGLHDLRMTTAKSVQDHPAVSDRPYPVAVAVELFLGPPWTVSSLRTEIHKGRLEAERIAGKLAVTEAAIGEMRARCREKPKAQGSTSDTPERPARRSHYIRDGRSRKAQDALRATLTGLSERSPPTSHRSTEHPKTGGQLDKTTVADVVLLYVKEHAPKTKSLDFIRHTAKPIGDWWGDKTLAQINVKTCAEYVVWRVRQGVSDQTARHDLKTLRAAINYYNSSEYGPLLSLPVVTVPARWLSSCDDYYLTRKEVAARSGPRGGSPGASTSSASS